MEPLGTTYAKAVDDVSGKIFIPALISALLVEVGPILQHQVGLSLVVIYVVICIIGLILAPVILILIMRASIQLFKGHHIGSEIGVVLMPLGFAGLFPE